MATRHGTGEARAEGTRSESEEAGTFFGRLRLGEPRGEGGLEIVPLRLEGAASEAPVLLTRQAIEVGALEIVERGEGVVQELVAWNRGDRPVAILEGDTLVGCKQNRVVAHSVIVAPGRRLAVPVGCMERGRWHHQSRQFEAGDVKIGPALRRRTVADVKAATLSGRAPTLDQSRLWSDVELELAAAGVRSSTSDYYGIVEAAGQDVRERARRLEPAPGDVGAVVLAEGALVGLEASGHQGLWSALAEPTLASYLMGTQRGAGLRGARASAAEWLARVRGARVETRPGVGLGADLDLGGDGVSGIGLALDGFVVHVAVFPA